MRRRRSKQYENEDAVELQQVLEPYTNQQWSDEAADQDDQYEQNPEDDYPDAYLEGYEDFYGEDYSEAHEAADTETRFRIAIGLFDLISMIVGIIVVLLLVGLIVTLFNWLKNDILHSALLLQSGLQ